jgi:DNA-binding HxlR family transcriptional regulator
MTKFHVMVQECYKRNSLTTIEVKGRAERRPRAGTPVLSLLATPLNVCALQALAEGPRSLADLRRRLGSPPQTTMRRQLRALTEIGALTRQRQSAFPASMAYELTRSGRELVSVAGILEGWLARCPEGPLPLGSSAAKSAIGALVEGFETNMLRALAAKPLSLTELDDLISALSYPSLERRLAAMRTAGQIQPLPSRGRGTPYAVTEWLRLGVAPLGAAARWEILHLNGQAAPIGNRDTETSFLLAVPLLRLSPPLRGSCRLAVEVGGAGRHRLAGVMAVIEGGRITACTTRIEGNPDSWIVGSFAAWLAAVTEFDSSRLDLGGDRELALGILEGLHRVLYGADPLAKPEGLASQTLS